MASWVLLGTLACPRAQGPPSQGGPARAGREQIRRSPLAPGLATGSFTTVKPRKEKGLTAIKEPNAEPGAGVWPWPRGPVAPARARRRRGVGGRTGGALVQTTATASALAVGDRMCRMTTGCVGSRVNGSMPVNGQIRSTDKSGQRIGAGGVERSTDTSPTDR